MRAEFLGAPIDLLTADETVAIALEAMHSQSKITHVALNVAKFIKMRTNTQLRADVSGADIIGVDGMGIVWGARVLGIPVPERVSGIDLAAHILAGCARRGFRPFFLGATWEVVESAARAAIRAHRGLEIAGIEHGYFGPAEVPAILNAINDSGADCLLVGLPTPAKEHFIATHRKAINAPFVMGVGGAFDVMAGKVTRAPKAIQQSGLEWLYRTLQEPRRLICRYATTNAWFLLILLRELADRAITPARGRLK